jgi:hypothetical protein
MLYDSPDTPEIKSERAYVVYDPKTGYIVHVHQATTFRGVKGPSQTEEKQQALATAKQFGHRVEGAAVLAVAPDKLDFSVPLRIDLKTRKLTPG